MCPCVEQFFLTAKISPSLKRVYKSKRRKSLHLDRLIQDAEALSDSCYPAQSQDLQINQVTVQQLGQSVSVTLSLILAAYHNQNTVLAPWRKEMWKVKVRENHMTLSCYPPTQLHCFTYFLDWHQLKIQSSCWGHLNLWRWPEEKHILDVSFLPWSCNWRLGVLFMGHDKILHPESHRVTVELSTSASKPFEPSCFPHWALNILQGVSISNLSHKINLTYQLLENK